MLKFKHHHIKGLIKGPVWLTEKAGVLAKSCLMQEVNAFSLTFVMPIMILLMFLMSNWAETVFLSL